MDKEFIPYEQALALKELGFDEPCLSAFFENKIKRCDNIKNSTSDYLSAVLYQQAFRWFRENYSLEHKILRDSYGCRYQITKVTPTSLKDIDCKGQYSNTSYDEAELECLKKLIEIVKHKS